VLLNELKRKHLYAKVESGCKRKRTSEKHAAALLNGIPLSGCLYLLTQQLSCKPTKSIQYSHYTRHD
jgi:hypothetical protein